jgi:DNA-binding winged helix-turn-helix (wHTH) protein/tetratricopeptide (TPR) repeat protein/TolB-like protein
METPSQRRRAIRFGPFEADLTEERLLRNGLPVRLQDQPLRLLLLLLEHPGEIVNREEMRIRLWPTDSYGDFDNGLNVAVRKVRSALGDDTGAPRYIETVPRRGYRFIAEIVEVRAAAAGAAGLPDPLQPVPQPPSPPPTASDAGGVRKKRLVLLAASVLLVLIAVPVAFLLWRSHSPIENRGADSGSRTSRRSVAVLGFRNSSGRPEDAWLSTALSEMFSTELAAGDHLRLISGEDVVQVRLVQPKLDVDSVSNSTARKLREALDTDLIVSGSFVVVDSGDAKQVRLDVRLQDANSGEILTAVSDHGTETALFQLVGNVGKELRQKLGVSGVLDAEHTEVLASMPSTREAGELYSNGLSKLRAYDAMSARTFLEQSIAADPSFPLAHSALSDAWARLGYDQRAEEEAQKANDLSSSLLPTERLQVQARSWEARGEWDKAAEAYRSLYAKFPDDPEYAVALASSLTRAGKGKEALALLEPRRKTAGRGKAEENAKIDLAIADAALALGDLDRASQASEAAASTAKAQGQMLVAAQALRTQGTVLESLKQYERAMTVTEQARQIYLGAGDRFGVASVLEVQADVFSDRGDLAGALDKYQQELNTVRDVGYKRGQASALNNMALVLNQQGDLERSRAMWEQAVQAFTELGDKSNTSVVLVNIGGVLKDQGDVAQARSKYQQALALSREMNDAGGTVLALNALGTALDAEGDFAGALKLLRQSVEIDRANGQKSVSSENLADQADVLQHQGDLAGARKAYEDALAASQASGEKSLSAYALFGMGRIAFLSGDLSAAQRSYVQALQIRKELGEIFTIAETEMALAELQIEQGHPVDAEPALRRVRDVFLKARKQDDLVGATAILAQSLLLQGKNAEAGQELDAMPPPAQIQNIEARLAASIAKGRLQKAMGKLPEARLAFQSALKEAGAKGYRGSIFESRLELLECEPASAKRSTALDALSRDAKLAGFSLIADRAHRESGNGATSRSSGPR